MAEQRSLLKSFNTDFFLKVDSNSEEQPTIRIKPGYENTIFINGRRISELVSQKQKELSLTGNDNVFSFSPDAPAQDVSGRVMYVEPTNISLTTMNVDASDASLANTLQDFPDPSKVQIYQDQTDTYFCVKGKKVCDGIATCDVSTSDDFFSRDKRPEKGSVIRISDSSSDYFFTMISLEDEILSGLKYIDGKIIFAADSSVITALNNNNISEITISPREVDGDIKGFDERKIYLKEKSDGHYFEHTIFRDYVEINLTPENEADDLSEDSIIKIEVDQDHSYDASLLYYGPLYTGEFFKTEEHGEEATVVSDVETLGSLNITIPTQEDKLTSLMQSSIGETQTDFIEIPKEWIDNYGMVHVHIDATDDIWFDYNPTPSNGQNSVEEYVFNSGWRYEQSLSRPERMVGEKSSFQLLRANPKLTGNVKVVVDSSSNIYLDTFKVSKALSQKKFRKIKLNPSDYYGRSLMTVFKNISMDDFYKVEDFCYNIFSYSNNLNEQYYDKYNSGVRTNTDKLYKENFSMLAPIKIKSVLPDFFVVFKVKPTDGKYYEDEDTNENRIKYFIKNGEIVKTYDMREGSNLGKFIRNIQKHSEGYSGDVFVSYDYNTDNVYHGISLDRGAVAEIHESVANTRGIKNQASMNDWYTLGFERNKIVSKDIVNLEFMFDDKSENLFSLTTYFGLYIRLNGESEDFSCVDIVNGYPKFNYPVTGKTFRPEAYMDLIYGMSTPEEFKRLPFNIQSLDASTLMAEYNKKAYKNVAKTCVIDIANYEGYSFASVKLNESLEPGEHYRVIDSSTKNIYEVIASNYESENFDISEVSSNSYTIGDDVYNIHTVSIYNIPFRTEIDERDKDELISMHCHLLSAAFNQFDEKLIISEDNGLNSVSILYNRVFKTPSKRAIFDSLDDYVILEKITSLSGVTNAQREIMYTRKDESSYLFGLDSIESVIVNYSSSTPLYPYGFDMTGDRQTYSAFFVPLKDEYGNLTAYLVNSNITDDIKKVKSCIYPSSNENAIYKGFEISSVSNSKRVIKHSVLSTPGFGTGDNHIMMFESDSLPTVNRNYIMFYESYPINAGLCSIFSIKDIFTDVLDASSYLDKFGEDASAISKYYGEYNENTVFGPSTVYGGTPVSEDNICNYFDKDGRYDVSILDSSVAEDTLLTNMYNSAKYTSDISLIYNYCCKFKTLGTDFVGNKMRVMYDLTRSYNTSDVRPEFGNEFPGFVTIDQSVGTSYPKYINNNIVYKDHVLYRDYILNGEGSIDDTLYFEGSTFDKFSTAYRNGLDSLEFISSGIKLRIKSNNLGIFNIAKYDGYSAILICCAGNNPLSNKAVDLIIDEPSKELAVIFYNGTPSSDMIIDGSVITSNIINVPHWNKLTDSSFIDGSLGTKVSYQDDKSDKEFNGLTMLNGSRSLYDYMEDKLKWISSNNGVMIDSIGDVSAYILNGDNLLMISDSSLMSHTQHNIDAYFESDVPADMFIFGNAVEGEMTSNGKTLTHEAVNEILSESKNYSIFVKTENGLKNFTSIQDIIETKVIGIEDNLSREDTNFEKLLDGSAYSTYAEPVTKDMISFDYSYDTLSTIFEKSFDGCNLRIKTIENVDQIFLKKYSTDDFTQDGQKKTGISEFYDLCPVKNTFETKLFRTFTDPVNFQEETGVQTGYIKNTFLGSQAITLNGLDGNELNIQTWLNSSYSRNITKLNVTDSIYEHVMRSPGFKSIWAAIGSVEDSYKSKFIKNTIIDLINVTENCKLEIYKKQNSGVFEFARSESDFSGYDKVNNVENKIYKDGDSYFIEITNLEQMKYAVKLNIKL